MIKYFDTVIATSTGRPLPGALVRIKDSNGDLATIYSDASATSLSNPVTTDSNGFFEFFIADGTYTLEFLYGGELIQTISDVEIFDSDFADITVDNDNWSGTDLAVANGGTGASTAADARTNLGAQESNALLTLVAALADPGADKLLFWDESSNAFAWLEPAANLAITGTDLDAALTLASTIAQSGAPAATSVGFLGSPQISDQDDYTLALTDSGGHYYHTSATPHTLTIPANASVAFPVGTVIGIVNENGGGDLTIAITSDTLRWTDQTGSRTLAADGTATLIKVAATVWRLTGDGIT